MTRPPKVSAALLKKANRRLLARVNLTTGECSCGGTGHAHAPDCWLFGRGEPVARHPLGVLPNALPSMWLAWRGEDLLVMEETASGQRCLGVIPSDTLRTARAAKNPLTLYVAPEPLGAP